MGDSYLLLDEPVRTIAVSEPSYQIFKRASNTFFAATCAFTLGRAQ